MKSAFAVTMLLIGAPAETAADTAPSLDQVVTCASLHGWLNAHSDLSPADRETAGKEALWFMTRAMAIWPQSEQAAVDAYKSRVADRKQRAAMAFFDGDPAAEAELMQDTRAEIEACSGVGAAIQPR